MTPAAMLGLSSTNSRGSEGGGGSSLGPNRRETYASVPSSAVTTAPGGTGNPIRSPSRPQMNSLGTAYGASAELRFATPGSVQRWGELAPVNRSPQASIS